MGKIVKPVLKTVMVRMGMSNKVYTVAMVEVMSLILLKMVQCRAVTHDVVLVLGGAILVILWSTVVVMVYVKKVRRWPIVQLMDVHVAMGSVTLAKILITAPKTVNVITMVYATFLRQWTNVLSIVIVGMVYARLMPVKPLPIAMTVLVIEMVYVNNMKILFIVLMNVALME